MKWDLKPGRPGSQALAHRPPPCEVGRVQARPARRDSVPLSGIRAQGRAINFLGRAHSGTGGQGPGREPGAQPKLGLNLDSTLGKSFASLSLTSYLADRNDSISPPKGWGESAHSAQIQEELFSAVTVKAPQPSRGSVLRPFPLWVTHAIFRPSAPLPRPPPWPPAQVGGFRVRWRLGMAPGTSQDPRHHSGQRFSTLSTR